MTYKEKRYCAFCKNLRTYYMKKDITLVDFVACGLVSLAIMTLVWQELNIKVFYFFGFVLIGAEVLVRLRWRMKMICHICGFDPILYKKDSKRAADKVKAFLVMRKTDTQMLLKPQPKLTPLKVKVAMAKAIPTAKIPSVKMPSAQRPNADVKSSRSV